MPNDVTPTTPAEQTRPRGLVQAPIEPVDDSGVRAFLVGTVLFAIAAVVLAVRFSTLSSGGHGWYLGVAVAGTVVGACGTLWTIRRARRVAAQKNEVSRTATRRH